MTDLIDAKPFRVYPFHASTPQLFHVSCEAHVDQGFCGEIDLALRNLADHIESTHPELGKAGTEK